MEDDSNPELRTKMDELMNKIIARSKPDPFEEAVISFFEEYLNPVLVHGVLKKYKDKHNINKIGELTSSERLEFADQLVKIVFARIRTSEEISLLRNQIKHKLLQIN